MSDATQAERNRKLPSGYRYWAFISYSHRDEQSAKWLHEGIETYKIPGALVGKPLHGGSTPRRMFPLFRDRDELASAAELGAQIRRALEQSLYLIVICSPRAANLGRQLEAKVSTNSVPPFMAAETMYVYSRIPLP